MYYLTENDVLNNLEMSTVIEAVREAFIEYHRGEAGAEARIRMRTSHSMLNVMPAFMNKYGISGLKVYTAGETGAKFEVLIFDAERNEIIAAIEANRLGQMRTGAVTALATSLLRGKCDRFALIGSGFQAETQLEGILSLFDTDVRVFSRTHANCERFVERMKKKFGRKIECAESLMKAVEGADVISCITSSSEPIITDLSFLDEYHLNLAGANIPSRREASTDVLMQSDLVVAEHLEQAIKESSEITDFLKKGGRVVEFKDVVANPSNFRGKRTIFKSMGIGLEDIATGYQLLKNMGLVA
ncbi:MAG: ornithine cyclodeaminase [Thermoplasmata archaeon]